MLFKGCSPTKPPLQSLWNIKILPNFYGLYLRFYWFYETWPFQSLIHQNPEFWKLYWNESNKKMLILGDGECHSNCQDQGSRLRNNSSKKYSDNKNQTKSMRKSKTNCLINRDRNFTDNISCPSFYFIPKTTGLRFRKAMARSRQIGWSSIIIM